MADSVVDIEDFSDSMKMFTKSEISQLRPQLLSWYRANRRFFPWRGDAGDGYDARPFTAYGCWVSEIMLQQTRTDTVIPYWNRWMDKWPTVDALAAASPEEVNSLWAGLGYYRRAQQLLQGARKVVADLGGVLPQAAEQLQEVPGIGPYTAGAISSIAYRKVEPVVDGNVIRVLSRLRAIEVEMGPALTRDCWRLARDIVDPEHPGDFNQAMMELGATICKPLNPDCSKCPLSTICQARLNHEMNTQKLVSYYPLKAEKKAPKQLVFNVHVLYRKPSDIVEYLFIKRPSRGLLANQWEFPTFELNGGVAGVSESMKLIGVDCITEGNPDVGASDPLVIISSTVVNNPVVHLFSHQHHTMYISVHFVKNTADVTIRGDREVDISTCNEAHY